MDFPQVDAASTAATVQQPRPRPPRTSFSPALSSASTRVPSSGTQMLSRTGSASSVAGSGTGARSSHEGTPVPRPPFVPAKAPGLLRSRSSASLPVPGPPPPASGSGIAKATSPIIGLGSFSQAPTVITEDSESRVRTSLHWMAKLVPGMAFSGKRMMNDVRFAEACATKLRQTDVAEALCDTIGWCSSCNPCSLSSLSASYFSSCILHTRLGWIPL